MACSVSALAPQGGKRCAVGPGCGGARGPGNAPGNAESRESRRLFLVSNFAAATHNPPPPLPPPLPQKTCTTTALEPLAEAGAAAVTEEWRLCMSDANLAEVLTVEGFECGVHVFALQGLTSRPLHTKMPT